MAWIILILVTMYSLLIICNVVGNGAFFLLFCTSHLMKKTITLLTISLVTADLIIGVFVAPMHLSSISSESWFHKDDNCHLVQFAYLSTVSVSILSLSGVATERYILIIFPLRYRTIQTVKRSCVAVAIVWLYSLVSAFFIFCDSLVGTPNLKSTNCAFNLPTKFLSVILFANYVIPFTVLLIISGHTLKISRRHLNRIFPDAVPKSFGVRGFRAQKASMATFLLLTVFVVCWLPIPIFSLVLQTVYDSEPSWTVTTYQALHLLSFASSALIPFLCGYSNGPFKVALKKYFLREAEIGSLLDYKRTDQAVTTEYSAEPRSCPNDTVNTSRFLK